MERGIPEMEDRRKFQILEANSPMNMESRIMDAMSEGWELYGDLSITPSGVFIQAMIRAKKIQRVAGS